MSIRIHIRLRYTSEHCSQCDIYCQFSHIYDYNILIIELGLTRIIYHKDHILRETTIQLITSALGSS